MKAFQAQSELVDMLTNVIKRHEKQLEAIQTYIEAHNDIEQAEVHELTKANEVFRTSLVEWMKATDSRIGTIVEQIGLN